MMPVGVRGSTQSQRFAAWLRFAYCPRAMPQVNQVALENVVGGVRLK